MRIFFFITFLVCSQLYSQTNEYLVFIKDKTLKKNWKKENLLSQRAINKNPERTLDFYDLSVSINYLNQMAEKGEIKNVSRWLNAVHYSSFLSQEEIQSLFPFITKIIPVNYRNSKESPLLNFSKSTALGDTNSYGKTFEQLEITKTISCLHDKGHDGENTLIAVLDAGFPKLDSMLAFQKLRQENRIIDTRDFEDNATNVYHKSTHGTFVSTILCAELDSSYVGSAPKADYAFYITEIARFERNIEEFNLVLGLERADSIGADICSISLGYRNFDTLQVSYDYSGMDGNTTLVAQGVSIAKNKGMILSVAAGNKGSGAGTLTSPCDADSILCVGAIKYDSTRAGFSSEGPTFDGRTKPDVVTIGEACHFVGLNDTVYYGNGTSFSTPLMSGLVACLKQAHPLRTSFEIMDAIRNNADNSTSPNNVYGWGIPNGCKTDSVLSYLDSTLNSIPKLENTELSVLIFPNPTKEIIYLNSAEILESIHLKSVDGKVIKTILLTSSTLQYSIPIQEIPMGIYVLNIKSQDGRTVTKRVIKN